MNLRGAFLVVLVASSARALDLAGLATESSAPLPRVPEPPPGFAAPAAARPALLDRISPFQSWPALGPKAAGLLVQRRIGSLCLIDHLRSVAEEGAAPRFPCVEGPANVYAFDADGASPVAVYFKSEGQGYNFIPGFRMSNGFRADAAMFNGKTPNAWGLRDEAHVVSVTVNGGLGSGGDIHFIATAASVVDGAAGAPSSPAGLIRGFLAPYASPDAPAVKAVAERLERALAEREARNPGDDGHRRLPKTTRVLAGFTAGWRGKEGLLRVVYYRRLETAYVLRERRGGTCAPPRCEIVDGRRRCAPPPPCPPPIMRERRFTYGAEYAVQADFAKDGSPGPAFEHPIETFYEAR